MGTKCRLRPTTEVEQSLLSWCDHERFLYNLCVGQFEFAFRYRGFAAHPNEAAKSRQHWPSPAERARQLAELRGELDWLRSGPSAVQQQALRVVDRAYANWFKNPAHFRRPTFRSRHATQGIGVAGRGYNFEIRKTNRRWGEVKLPKLRWVKFRLTVPWTRIEDAKSLRVTRDKSGRWFISFPSPQPKVERTATGAIVGIDRGIVNTIATSDGALSSIRGPSPKQQERKRRLERQIDRQTSGSRNQQKTRLQLNRLIATETGRARAFIEEYTTELVRNYDVIVLEDLKISNMTKRAKPQPDPDNPGQFLKNNAAAKSGLNREILRSRWGMFEQRLREKADTCEVRVIGVPARNTSRECAKCGHTEKKNRESQASFFCQVCGHADHADTNAALIIRGRGEVVLAATMAGGSTVTAHRDLGVTRSVKCEASKAA
jgi:putative transposase